MKPRFIVVAALAAIVAILSPSLSAQWPLYPLPGVPKGPDGKPNLSELIEFICHENQMFLKLTGRENSGTPRWFRVLTGAVAALRQLCELR